MVVAGSPLPHQPKVYNREYKTDLNACPDDPVRDLEGSPDVFVNLFHTHRVEDLDECHPQMEGSPNVYANQLRVARLMDRNRGLGPELTGSPDTYANSRNMIRAPEPRPPQRTIPIPPFSH